MRVLGFELVVDLQVILTVLPIAVGILVGIPLLAVIGKVLSVGVAKHPAAGHDILFSTAFAQEQESNDVEAPESLQAEACLDQSTVVSLINSHPSSSELGRRRQGQPLCDEDMHARVYNKALCKGRVWVKIGARKPDQGREIKNEKLEKFLAEAGKTTFEDKEVEKLREEVLKGSDLWTGVFISYLCTFSG